MYISVKNINEVKNTINDSTGFIFIDAADDQLKMKKSDKIIEFFKSDGTNQGGTSTPVTPSPEPEPLPTVTVTADKLLNGVTAINTAGDVVTGTIPTVTLQRNGNTVSINKGYVSKADSIEITQSGTEGDVVITVDTTLIEFDAVRYESYTEYINASINNDQPIYFLGINTPSNFSINQNSGEVYFNPQYVTNDEEINEFKIFVFSDNALTKSVTVKYSVEREWGYIEYYDHGEDTSINAKVGEEVSFNIKNQFSVDVSNGATPYFSINSDDLPNGLTYNQETGIISGTVQTSSYGSFIAIINAEKCDPYEITVNYSFYTIIEGGTDISSPLNWDDIKSSDGVTASGAFEIDGGYVYVKLNTTANTKYAIYFQGTGGNDPDIEIFRKNDNGDYESRHYVDGPQWDGSWGSQPSYWQSGRLG